MSGSGPQGSREWRLPGDGPPDDPERPTIEPGLREEVVAFLRDWIPAGAAATYRQMIRSDPDGWYRSSHFASGFVVEHLLRGNGITEAALGVRDLEPLWPGLLRDAVMAAGARSPEEDRSAPRRPT
jgi:hypothetical protein